MGLGLGLAQHRQQEHAGEGTEEHLLRVRVGARFQVRVRVRVRVGARFQVRVRVRVRVGARFQVRVRVRVMVNIRGRGRVRVRVRGGVRFLRSTRPSDLLEHSWLG